MEELQRPEEFKERCISHDHWNLLIRDGKCHHCGLGETEKILDKTRN